LFAVEEVENVIKVNAGCKKIPVVIGGGHNNAYPIIKGVAKGYTKQMLFRWRRSM